MNLAQITPAVIESSLRALRNGAAPDPALLAIEWTPGVSEEENSLKAAEVLLDLVWESYAEQRRLEDLETIQPANREAALRAVQVDFCSKNGDLHACSALYYRYAAPMPFSVEELAQAAGIVPQQFRRRLNQGLAQLTQRVQRLAVQTRRFTAGSDKYLPLPDYTRLIGIQPYFQALDSLLSDPAGPALVSLEGMGGIGKTSLARAYVSLAHTKAVWDAVLWVSARQQYLTESGRLTSLNDPAATLEDISARLAEQLNLSGLAGKALPERLDGLLAVFASRRALCVVDNLETVEDQEQLVPALAKLAGSSRFLLTTRQTLRNYPFVHTISLKALDADSAFELLRSESQRRGRRLEISTPEFQAFYRLIGGVPLAIKLVAAQLSLQPLQDILDGFRRAGQGMQDFYRYLYWQTWQSLSDPARRLLLSFLPANPEGEDLDFLRVMSGQADDSFFSALAELDRFSLLEITGDASQPLYRLHQITVTFLKTDILSQWSENQPHDRPASP